MAVLAVGCQKTEIQNEVQNQIGFSTETGKMTRAIVQDGTYLPTQPFAVYAYGYQLETVTLEGQEVTQRKNGTTSTPMVNVEISCDDNNTPTTYTDDIWSATGTTKYYWPNDPRTRLDFYAYSPAQDGTATAAHQQLTCDISHSEQENPNDLEYGLVLSEYVHSNMYVDFMVATPITGATYSNQTVGTGNTAKSGVVSLDFKHEMTQINFVVKLDAAETTNGGVVTSTDNKYPNIDFTIKSIVLNNIVSGATYKYNDPNQSTTGLRWTPTQNAISSYMIYPATTASTRDSGEFSNSNGAPDLTNEDANGIEKTVVLRTDNRQVNEGEVCPGYKFSTTPVTMIPQAWNTTPLSPQSFTITYEISGEGVATEEIVKTFNFNAATNSAHNWVANKKITYTLTIGLREITFSPSVSTWDELTGSYTDDPSNV